MRKNRVPAGLQKVVAVKGVKQIGFGLSLLLPATAFMARVPELSTGRTAETQQLEEQTRASMVAGLWKEQTTETGEAGTEATVASLAAEYKVPVHLAADIHEAAVSESIDPKIAFGLVRAESRFRSTIVSPVGAVGLTQVMPATARWLVPGTSSADLRDPETNLKVGFKYLHSLLDRYEGNEKLALTAYNRGPGTVSKILHRGGDPDNGYAEMVMTGKSAKHVKLMNAKFGKKHKTRGRS
jgi:soluble lytic murein transglycosylase-like protein